MTQAVAEILVRASGHAMRDSSLPQSVGPIARRPLHEEALDRLRDRIVQGDLLPGVRLNERVLSQRLGISRTPLREAFKVLASEGLVELLPNRGAIVAPVDATRIAHTLQVMGVMEGLIGELACAKATEPQVASIRALHYEMLAAHARRDLASYFSGNQAIHLALAEATGNVVLAHTYRQLNASVRRVRYMANLSQSRWDNAVREHEAILAALTVRDGIRLKTLLSEHLAQKTASVLAAIASSESREAA